MTRLFTVFLFAFIAFTSFPLVQAMADDKEATGETPKVNMEEVDKRQHAYDLMDAINQRISREQHDHFMRVYGNYNLIETVSAVRHDVESAVQACSENNPHIKDKLEERYTEWDSAIDPIMTESKANLENMILAQDYATTEELNEIFNSFTEVRTAATKQIEKIPVTTEEACLFLLGKMDETQEYMMKMLKSTLISLPPAAGQTEEKAEDIENSGN